MKLLKIKKLIAVFTVSLLFGISSVSAASSVVLAEAKNSGKVFHRITKDDFNVNLLPDSTFAADTKDFAFGNLEDSDGYIAESLYYVTKDELVEKSKAQDKSTVDTSILAVSKVVRSISKMEGMQYYSNSRKRYETLYTQSFRIADADSKQAIADDTQGSADGKTIYMIQTEHNFGATTYQVSYRENANAVSMKIKNVFAMKFGIIKAVDPEDFKVVVNIVDDGDGYYIYLGMSVDMMKMSFLEKKMNKSFQARLDALYNWITYQF